MTTPARRNRPVLCGTDFSVAAGAAADAAAGVARALGVPLLLVHAFEPVAWWSGLSGAGRTQESMARQALKTEADRLRRLGCSVRAVLRRGKPPAVLHDLATGGRVSLLVLGAGDAPTGRRAILGTTAERTVAEAAVPVLVVRKASPIVRWGDGGDALRLFAAFDFSQASEAALAWLPNLTRARACHVTVGFAHGGVAEPSPRSGWNTAMPMGGEGVEAGLARDLEERATPLLGAMPDAVAIGHAAGAADRVLAAMADRARADVVVVGTHVGGVIDQLWYRSVSRSLLREARVNVLCVPGRAAWAALPPVPHVRRVLVGVDFSAPSLRAVAYACAVASPGTSIRLVHVVHPRAVGGGAADTGLRRSPAHDTYVRRERTRLERLRRSMDRPGGEADDVAIVEDEDVPGGLCAEAARFGADLVVLGTLGLSGLQRAAAGSIAGDVLERCGRPVLVVRAPRA